MNQHDDTTTLSSFFNAQHEKLLCTANRDGEPNVSLMGTPRMPDDDTIEFEISDKASLTLDNLGENAAVVLMTYLPGPRARDYRGVRVYARVTAILTSGEKLERLREDIRARVGEQKANELRATVSCRVTRVRPIVDRGQPWNHAPFENDD